MIAEDAALFFVKCCNEQWLIFFLACLFFVTNNFTYFRQYPVPKEISKLYNIQDHDQAFHNFPEKAFLKMFENTTGRHCATTLLPVPVCLITYARVQTFPDRCMLPGRSMQPASILLNQRLYYIYSIIH